MTPEERAKAVVAAENQFCEEHSLFVRGDTLDRLEYAIASAIREAEFEALNRVYHAVRAELDENNKATVAAHRIKSMKGESA